MHKPDDVGIKDGHPYTHWKVFSSDDELSVDDALLSDLTEEQQRLAVIWAMTYMMPTETPNNNHTSYGLKHILEHDMGFYLTNNQFKDLMLQMGHEPVDEHAVNWRFRISEVGVKMAGSRVISHCHVTDRPRGWMNPFYAEVAE